VLLVLPVLPVLGRYLTREAARPLPAVLGLLLFGLGLLQAERLGPLVMSAGADPASLVRLGAAVVPLLAVAALPGAVLASLLAGLGRVRDDGELEAMRALGRGPAGAAAAAMCVGAAAAAAALATGLWAEPWCRGELKRAAGALARAAAERALRAGEVVEVAPGVTLVARAVAEASGSGPAVDPRRGAAAGSGAAAEAGRGTLLEGVVLHDGRDGADRWMMAARVKARVEGDALALELSDGEVHEAEADGALARLSFAGYRTSIDLGGTLGGRTHWLRDFEALGPGALLGEAARREAVDGAVAGVPVRFFFWQKLAVAAACLPFAALGALLVLGGGARRGGSGGGGGGGGGGGAAGAGGRLRAYALGIGATALYYGVGRAGETLAYAGALPPWAGAGLPVATAALAVAALAARGALRRRGAAGGARQAVARVGA
jgi:lipopolysaccharide export LptBFGC system permease protein LptF